VAGVDVLGETVGVDEGRIGGDVALDVVGGGDDDEQLHVRPQPTGARLADRDGALHRHLRLGALIGVRASHGEVDRRRCGQALRGRHERFGLVSVVGAFGLAQQRRDARQHLVVTHTRIRSAPRSYS